MQEGDLLPAIEKQVTQDSIAAYADASGDYNPIHLNEEFAMTTQFAGTIAHGMFVLAFVSEMLTVAFREQWLASGTLKIRFRGAVRPGDTVTTFGEVKKVMLDGEREIVSCAVGARTQTGDTAIAGDATVTLPAGWRP